MRTKMLITLVFSFTAVVFSFAENDKYLSAMQKNIEQLHAAADVPALQQAVNNFERIGEAEKSKWEPWYYASFGYVMMATREKEAAQKDAYLDQALKGIDKAKALNADASEITTMEGFVHMIRVTVDPASRGQQYSGLAFQAFSKAVALNPENPRALALLAQMQYGTAQFFGSPVTEACTTLNSALKKFETYKSENPIAPDWGKKMAEGMKAACK
jgi:tetratricopeptide (TPR) repeat protein